jgi:hypothetical protein
MKIIYEPHPINPARKAKLQSQGYKIIDAVFAPPGTPLHEKLEVEDVAEETEDAVEVEAVEAEAEVVEADEAEETDEEETAEEGEVVVRKRGRPRKE